MTTSPMDYSAGTELRQLLLHRILAEGGGGGGGGETAAKTENKSFNYMVYSPSYYIATVTAILIVVSVLFEKLIHVIHRWFGKKKNRSLVHVVDRIKDELMVAGFLAIVLALINPLLVGWCVPVARDNILIPCKPPEVPQIPARAAAGGSAAEIGGSPADAVQEIKTTGEFNFTDKPGNETGKPGGDGAKRSTFADVERFANGSRLEVHKETIAFANGTKIVISTHTWIFANQTRDVTSVTTTTLPDGSISISKAGEVDLPKAAPLRGRGLVESSSEEYANGVEEQILRLIVDWKGQRHKQRLLLESLLPNDVGSFDHRRGRQLAEFTNKCPAGQEPFMSPAAIHQLHLFIFFLIVGHIAYTCITIIIARAKVSRWKNWELNCQKHMAERKTPVSGQLSRALRERDFIHRRTGPLAGGMQIHALDADDVTSSSVDEDADVEQPPASMEQQPNNRVGAGGGGGTAVGASEGVALEENWATTFKAVVREASEAKGREEEGNQQQQQQEQMPQHFSWIGEDEYDMDVVYGEEEREKEGEKEREREREEREEEKRRQDEREGGGEGIGGVPKKGRSVRWSQGVGAGAVEGGGKEAEGGKGGDEEGGEGGTGGGGAGGRADGKRLLRSNTMARREASKLTIWQSLLLTLQCFWQQLVNPITKSDYYTLRLAYIHNQHLPRDFNFYHHLICSLEKDFVHIVGLSWHLWFTLVVMMCVTSYMWDVSFIFSILGFIVVLAVGTKLEYIVSVLALESAHVRGACEGDHLKPRASLFWFRRPSFMLHLLHFAMFVSSYMIGNLITFYYLLMNKENCKQYSSWQPWLKFIVGIATLLICSLSTLPLYALVIHMGARTTHSTVYSRQTDGTCSRCDKDKALAADAHAHMHHEAHQETPEETPASPSTLSHMKRIKEYRSKDDVRV